MECAMLPQHSRPAAPWTVRSAAQPAHCTGQSRLSKKVWVTLTALLGLIASTASVSGQAVTGAPDPVASGWRPWVLSSTKEVQVQPSGNQSAELQQLHSLAKQRGAA